MIQGSDAWHEMRLGKVTASRVADVVCRTKVGWGAGRGNYLAELVCERLTGRRTEGFTSDAMARGSETEPQARAAYEFHTDCDVEQVAFVEHPSIPMAGCSPDGLVGTDGLLEIKCPSSKVHIATLLGGEPDGRYFKQVQWQMACTGRRWADLASFDPRLPPEMQLSVTRINRDENLIKELQYEVVLFLKEVEETVDELRARYQPTAEAA
jgi:putative phage-type endonuclease